MTKVSVVVCAMNEEECIEDCLKALKAQTIVPEIIIVDGHSTDKTIKVSKKYADKIIKDNKKGLGEARNIGWKQASGDIIAYCDADCTPRKKWIANIIKLLKKDKILGVSGPLYSTDCDDILKISIKFWADYIPIALTIIGYHSCWGANMAFKRKALEKYPFRVKFLEDYDVGHRLRKINAIRFSDKMRCKMSSRRFKMSNSKLNIKNLLKFYKVIFIDYIGYTTKVKITGKRHTGYFMDSAKD